MIIGVVLDVRFRQNWGDIFLINSPQTNYLPSQYLVCYSLFEFELEHSSKMWRGPARAVRGQPITTAPAAVCHKLGNGHQIQAICHGRNVGIV